MSERVKRYLAKVNENYIRELELMKELIETDWTDEEKEEISRFLDEHPLNKVMREIRRRVYGKDYKSKVSCRRKGGGMTEIKCPICGEAFMWDGSLFGRSPDGHSWNYCLIPPHPVIRGEGGIYHPIRIRCPEKEEYEPAGAD